MSVETMIFGVGIAMGFALGVAVMAMIRASLDMDEAMARERKGGGA